MEEKYLWEEQLEKFKKAYISKEINQQYLNYLKEKGFNNNISQAFIPNEALNLYTFNNNQQYNLNGRSIFGVQRKWNLEKVDNQYKVIHGCSINPGLIQADHSEFMHQGNMSDIFIEVKDSNELLENVKSLFNLSNEEMARKFNITSSREDIATLLNAVILDPIINYEIERGNFGGYTHCWNDNNDIKISTKSDKELYTIGLENSSRDRYQPTKTMLLELPNGESVTFIQKFNTEKEKSQYTIDDVSTEIVEIKGNSELIQKVVAQIERFSEKKLEKEENIEEQQENIDKEEESAIEEKSSEEKVYDEEGKLTEEELLTRQIIVKKIQVVIDNFKNGNNTTQPLELEEAELLSQIIYESIYDRKCIGYESSATNVAIQDQSKYTVMPAKQCFIIQLPNNKRVCAEFLDRERKGTIKIKDLDKMKESEDDSDFIKLEDSIDEQRLMDSFGIYFSNESLKELLKKKLRLQEKELSELEKMEKTITETEASLDQNREEQGIGEE